MARYFPAMHRTTRLKIAIDRSEKGGEFVN